ncbi:hypothetical protein OE88DRAFT_1732530 [Heliocybe sulcata]|uniref:F-box domain-containing protein n=1 Tax=Heliocybe sulcata TaxID=5364 RepID=A0A5C3NBT5_9AGAM|nr:hypothetical protein OE88DRAFT_1732530 [Heliocybe sulcata]
MHRCLAISEVLRIIAGALSLDEDIESDTESSRPYCGTLSAMAQTCKTFRDPFLRELWKDLGSLQPLINCLPPDIWVKRYTKTWFDLTKPTQSLDLTRFEYYAPLVKSVVIEPASLGYDAIPALTFLRRTTYVLPNLEELYWTMVDSRRSEIFPYIHAFLAPSLHSLTLSLEGRAAEDTFSLFLDFLAAACSSLRCLDLVVDQENDQPTLRLAKGDSLTPLNLAVFRSDCLPIDKATLISLAGIPTLEEAWLYITGDVAIHLRRLPESSFPALKKLHLADDFDFRGCATIVNSTSFPHLESLNVTCEWPTLAGVTAILGTVQKHCCSNKLHQLEISCNTMTGGGRTVELNLDIIQSLAGFGNLRELSFHFPCWLNFNDSDLEDLSKAASP